MKYSIIRWCVILFIFQISLKAQTPDIYINEIMASNTNQIMDPDFHIYSDWVEIFNNGDNDINLQGYFLTDVNTNPAKYRIDKDILLPSKTYLIIWCDDRDTILQAVHTNFKLRADEDRISLYNADTSLIDSVCFSHQKTDISYGRVPDSYYQWAKYENATPGKINSNKGHKFSLEPFISLRPGYYESNQKIHLLHTDPTVIVRYTLDGTDPTVDSPIFPDTLVLCNRTSEPNFFANIPTNKDPFVWLPAWTPPSGDVFKATVIKFCAFVKEKKVSEIVSNTYFIADDMLTRYEIPVISIITDPDNLFNDSTGIFVPGITHKDGESGTGNYFQDWEKEVHITYFDSDGSIGFSQNAGIRIQGGSSPASALKAFHVIARNKYGNNRFNYPLFKDTKGHAKNIQQYKRFIIRAWGSCIQNAMLNDALAHNIMEKSDLDLQSYQPVILFINGEYWGVHEMRETNKSNWYFEVHYGVDSKDPGIDLIYHQDRRLEHHPLANEGNLDDWLNFTDYIHSHDLSKKECYEYVKTQLDVENLIDYMALSIYLGKWDWPGMNEATWRPRTKNGRWRYITFDMETGFGAVSGIDPAFQILGPQFNMFDHVMEGTEIPIFGYFGPHLVFRELMKNEEFANTFIKNMEEKINNEFSSDVTTVLLDEMVNQIKPYMAEHWARWYSGSEAFMKEAWKNSIDGIRDYMEQRPAFLNEQLEEFKAVYVNI